jgi:hypothetical protein
MEYLYEDTETAERDMAQWQIPAIGTKQFGGQKIIKSTILTNLNFEGESNG